MNTIMSHYWDYITLMEIYGINENAVMELQYANEICYINGSTLLKWNYI